MQKKFIRAAGLAVAASLIATGANAAESSRQPARVSTPTVAYQGVQVSIDPATGRIRPPTDAERQALSQALGVQGTREPPRPRTEAEARSTLKRSGTGRIAASMQVPESQFNYLVAERNADGTLRVHHQDADQASDAAPQEVMK